MSTDLDRDNRIGRDLLELMARVKALEAENARRTSRRGQLLDELQAAIATERVQATAMVERLKALMQRMDDLATAPDAKPCPHPEGYRVMFTSECSLCGEVYRKWPATDAKEGP